MVFPMMWALAVSPGHLPGFVVWETSSGDDSPTTRWSGLFNALSCTSWFFKEGSCSVSSLTTSRKKQRLSPQVIFTCDDLSLSCHRLSHYLHFWVCVCERVWVCVCYRSMVTVRSLSGWRPQCNTRLWKSSFGTLETSGETTFPCWNKDKLSFLLLILNVPHSLMRAFAQSKL